MQILGLLVMYFDAAVVFVTSHSLLFRLVLVLLLFRSISDYLCETFHNNRIKVLFIVKFV